MSVYLGKDKLLKKGKDTNVSHNVVKEMIKCLSGRGHKLFMDNCYSSPNLFLDLLKEDKMNCVGTIKIKRKNFPKDVVSKKMKKGDLNVKCANGMIAMCWRDKREVLMLSNMHHPKNQNTGPEKNEKPEAVKTYNEHMGYFLI
ncbi:hypothetical protein JTE90_006624 [Oedothorax gibbosus]|uniref:PiggyBac transposable element-derived protein domain-containing protein n=1 Tax=Oedothorax gibbosus TaxID=931172 RepID=A0AAV6U6R5_9ARAC|nr:hypothetical protein JTE90_006624 [Oedothorax gibbosus]